MFETLTQRLSRTAQQLRGEGRLTEDNIEDTLRDVRMALLEADVALPVVREFVDKIRERALGQDVLTSVKPGQALVRIVNDELVRIMGEPGEALNLKVKPPAVVLVAGLQGAGKTTTVGKLARWLREREKKKVMVVSCDVHRPAAIEQLETVAEQAGVLFCRSSPDEKAEDIVQRGIEEARRQFADVLLIDSAGRLHVDTDMMAEVRRVHAVADPVETLFVMDAMTGQDAVNSARAFDEALPLTGVILTKVDGDARGGAALSVRQITGKPIRFLGTGEALDAFEAFHPDRIASRILGMGDVVTLVEEAEQKVDKVKAEKLAHKLRRGQGFDLEDFRDQLRQMQGMGGLAGLMDKLPEMGGKLPARANVEEKQVTHMIAMIDSMTTGERRRPAIIKGSRKKRITAGSGTDVPTLNRLLKQFTQMQKMLKKMGGKGRMAKMLKGMGGDLPPGFPR
jgi:signal recognition particle subunit SRP54